MMRVGCCILLLLGWSQALRVPLRVTGARATAPGSSSRSGHFMSGMPVAAAGVVPYVSVRVPLPSACARSETCS